MDKKTKELIDEYLEKEKGKPDYTTHAYIEGFLDGFCALDKITVEEREKLYDKYIDLTNVNLP